LHFIFRYLFLSLLFVVSVYAQDDHPVGPYHLLDSVSGVKFIPHLFIKPADKSCLVLSERQVKEIDSFLINQMFEICHTRGYMPLERFTTVDSLKTFLRKLKTTEYQGESLGEVRDFLEHADFLLVSDKKIDKYLKSVVAQKSLLLYQLYKQVQEENRDFVYMRSVAQALRSVSSFFKNSQISLIDHDLGHVSSILSMAKIDTCSLVTVSRDCTAGIIKKNAQGIWRHVQRLGVVNNTDPVYGHTNSITCVAVLDRDNLVTGSLDSKAIVWQKNAAHVWHIHQTLGDADNIDLEHRHAGAIRAVTQCGNDNIVTASSDSTAIVWQKNAEGAWEFAQRLGSISNADHDFGHIGHVLSVEAISDDTLVTGSIDSTAIIWHKGLDGLWHMQHSLGAVNNNHTHIGHVGAIRSVLKIDEQTLATASYDHTTIIWRKNAHGVWAIHQRLGVARNHDVSLGHIDVVSSVIKLDEDKLVTVSWDGSAIVWQKGQDQLWQIEQRLRVTSKASPAGGHVAQIRSVVELEPGTFATGGDDCTTIIWSKNFVKHFEPLFKQAQLTEFQSQQRALDEARKKDFDDAQQRAIAQAQRHDLDEAMRRAIEESRKKLAFEKKISELRKLR
jgi:hypothetical protein